MQRAWSGLWLSRCKSLNGKFALAAMAYVILACRLLRFKTKSEQAEWAMKKITPVDYKSGVLRRAVYGVLTAIAAMALGSMSDATAADPAIRIGAPLPLTGALSPEGQKLQQGYEIWKDAVNANGGIAVGTTKRPVEIVYYDYQSATPKAVQIAEKLATDDKVDFMFSPFGSGATKAASTVSERYGIPTLAPTASSAEVYDQGYKNLFGTFTANDTLSEPMSDIVKAKAPEVKRVAILARNDLYPLALAHEFEKSVKKRGLDVVYFEKYAINTLDHASALTEIKSAKPDWIVATGYINDMILIRKQMADLGIKAQVVTMINAPAYQEFIDGTGPLSENVTSATWWHPAMRYKSADIFGSSEKYTEMFKAKYKALPDFTNATGSAVGVVLQMAIEKAGSTDRAKVREALASGGFETFFGPLTFNASGQAVSYVPPVFQIQNGSTAVIYPDAIKGGELKLGVR
jgi:branched-chain amino acid transport system substrate-binding protein